MSNKYLHTECNGERNRFVLKLVICQEKSFKFVESPNVRWNCVQKVISQGQRFKVGTFEQFFGNTCGVSNLDYVVETHFHKV